MAAIDLESSTVSAIYAAYENRKRKEARTYLGMSELGKECERQLWYNWRWAHPPEKLTGRKLRLFETGEIEEARLINNLRSTGASVRNDGDNQTEVSSVGGHLRGHPDGVAIGVKEAPKAEHVLECKTHNDKSFNALVKHGVEKSKPVHYAQMQLYMHYTQIESALYLAVNKNDDSIYSERANRNLTAAVRLITKAERIIASEVPPPKISEDPNYFECGWCPAKGICHEREFALRNCRTCAHSTPQMNGDGMWWCSYHLKELSTEEQRSGCVHHLYIPPLVPGKQHDYDWGAGWISYKMDDGSTWVDGGESARHS